MPFSFFSFSLSLHWCSVSRERGELCSLQPIYDQVQCTRSPLKCQVLVLEKVWKWSSFCYNISDVARCCACFANPFTTSSNTIQQCCKTFRWNVACVWPGLYNAARLLLKKPLVYPNVTCKAKSRVITSFSGEKWINPAAFKGNGNCRKI